MSTSFQKKNGGNPEHVQLKKAELSEKLLAHQYVLLSTLIENSNIQTFFIQLKHAQQHPDKMEVGSMSRIYAILGCFPDEYIKGKIEHYNDLISHEMQKIKELQKEIAELNSK